MSGNVRRVNPAIETSRAETLALACNPPIPAYLQQTYWWAYVHPRALPVFERDWLVNLILFGNYNRLRDAALATDAQLDIVDYHRPTRWNPLRPLVHAVFRALEPYAQELWRHDIAEFLPADAQPAAIDKQTFCGGLYQRLILTR